MAEPQIYHERQEMLLCGLHTLNALLQGPFWDEIGLATVAQELDRKEREVMAEAGMDTAEFQSFMAEESSNVANDGNFSIQVLTQALGIHNLTIFNIDSPAAQDATQHPQQEQAFICHLKAHWFTIRKVGGVWYDLNSLHAAPKFLSEFYLSAYLTSLKEEGWTVFVVRGIFPTRCTNRDTERSRYFTPAEAKEALLAADQELKREQAYVAAQALAETFPPQVGESNWTAFQGTGRRLGASSPVTPSQWSDPSPSAGISNTSMPSAPPVEVDGGVGSMATDDDYSRALALSLQEEEERALMAAIQESTRGQQSGSAGPSGVNDPQDADADRPLHSSSAQQPLETGSMEQSASGGGPVGTAVSDTAPTVHEASNSIEEPVHESAAAGSVGLSTGGHAAAQDAKVFPEPQKPPAAFQSTQQDSSSGVPASSTGQVSQMVDLAVRLPNGQRIRGSFLREDCIAAVEEYVRRAMGSSQSFVLAESGPRGKDLTDNKLTLDEAGIRNQTLLILKAPLLG